YSLYANWREETLAMARNPQVTVRSRGVMEKCTYCVQRIERARTRARVEDRKIHDGEIVTACQQACPAEAIVFGDVNDPDSRVSKLKADPRTYAMLAELNVRPPPTHPAKVTNPTPELEKETPSCRRKGTRSKSRRHGRRSSVRAIPSARSPTRSARSCSGGARRWPGSSALA